VRILHIHQDFPDPRNFPSTKAVLNLITATEEIDASINHYVVSINRTSNPLKISIQPFEYGMSIVYWALPLPYIYLPIMWFWSKVILFFLRAESFDIVHGHKLTTEGLLARYISVSRKKPLLISVRGGSDTFNLNRLKGCVGAFYKVAETAKHIFWVSPWAKQIVEKKLQLKLDSKSSNLPNICEIDDIIKTKKEPRLSANYVTVLSFHQYRRKGIFELLAAIVQARSSGIDICLDIYGGGDDEVASRISAFICANHLENQISLKGGVEHNVLLERLKHTKGLLLPSTNETFGMTYIEALACGNVILFHANSGVDGYFGQSLPGVCVKSKAIDELAAAIVNLDNNYSEYFSIVNEINQDSQLTAFTGSQVGQHYISKLA
jgi:glycosyltransferase involved in cell wall biosynthesis